MKTHTIKTPTAELLVVELPRVCDWHLCKDSISVFELSPNSRISYEQKIEGSYTLLGKPDEIMEEDAELFVDNCKGLYIDYATDEPEFYTAKESQLSLIESEIYWENPWGVNGSHLGSYKYLWQEAEQKTFDKNRTLIFKKHK